MICLDTSALIKLYVVERGSSAVIALVRREGAPGTASIAYTKVYSGLVRRKREGFVTDAQYVRISGQFEQDWPTCIQVGLRQDVLELGRDLLQRHPLRAFDDVHLASALTLRRQLEENILFAAADNRLLRAAAAEGLSTVNAEKETGA